MFDTIQGFLINLAKNSSSIELEDVLAFEKKLTVVMSKKNYMASFDVTSALDYDFLVINSNDEAIVFNKSKKLNDIRQLLEEINTDYNAFSQHNDMGG